MFKRSSSLFLQCWRVHTIDFAEPHICESRDCGP